jgi:WD40 repeat protein
MVPLPCSPFKILATIRVWNVDGECIKILKIDGPVVSLLFYKDSVFATWSKKSFFWGDSTMKEIHSFQSPSFQKGVSLQAHKEKITCMLVVNRELYSGSCDGNIHCWDINNAKTKRSIQLDRVKEKDYYDRYTTRPAHLDVMSEFETGLITASTTLLQCWNREGW